MRQNPFFHTVVLVGLGITGGCGDSDEESTDASSTDGQALADRVLADASRDTKDARQGHDAAVPEASMPGKDASPPDVDARIKKDGMVAIL